MDYNRIIRLVLLSMGLTLYMYFLQPKPASQPKENAQYALYPQSALQNTPFAVALQGVEEEVTVENDYYHITLSTKGGHIKRVLLKQYKDKAGKPVVLLDQSTNQMGLALPYQDYLIPMKDLYFSTSDLAQYKLAPGEQQQVAFRLSLSPNQYLEQVFTFFGDSYKINYAWKSVGLQDYISEDHQARFIWNMDIKLIESDTKSDAEKSTVSYYLSDHTFDKLKEHALRLESKSLNSPIRWIGIKQRFFCAGLIADQPQDCFQSGYLSIAPSEHQEETSKSAKVYLTLSKVNQTNGCGNLSLFFGPNDYATLKKVAPGFQRNISLGWVGIRSINQNFIIPLFYFLEKHLSSYGAIIALLVFIIKLILMPLSYRAFITTEKIKIIQPELDKLKRRYGDDARRLQTEQFLLYRELGINPLTGFLPILLQIPILVALFNFFRSFIGLRQKSFLWASDLSSYDSILDLPFSIPIYGNHVSLFTLLAVASMVFFKSSNPPSDGNGVMAKLAYIMPFSFMLVLNSWPAALSFYYGLSNVVNFIQQKITQYLIQKTSLKEQLLDKNKQRLKKRASFQKTVLDNIQSNNKPK